MFKDSTRFDFFFAEFIIERYPRNTTGYVDNGPPLLVKDKGTDSNEDTNIIFSCSFVINSRLTKTEDMSFVRQLFSALSISAKRYHKFGNCAAPVVKTK